MHDAIVSNGLRFNQIFNARGATHRQVPMRVDLNNPLKDYRVRQAIALTLDRPSIVKTRSVSRSPTLSNMSSGS